MTETIALNAYELANLADCGTPDTLESPGARFLLNVQSSVAEVLDAIATGEASYDLAELEDNASDEAHDIADSAVPIYTHELWATFVDLAAYQEDLGGGLDPAAMEQDHDWLARVSLYEIAQRLALVLLEQAGEES